MHPLPLPEILAVSALVAGAASWILARWRDLSVAPLTLAACAAIAEPRGIPLVLPAIALAGLGVVRGASRGVARPELPWVLLVAAGAAAAFADAVPGARVSVAAGLGVVGASLVGLATVTRGTVRVRPSFVGEVPIEGRGP